MNKSGFLLIAAVLAMPAVAGAQATATTTTISTTPASPPVRPMVPASSPTGPNSAENQKMVCRTLNLTGSRLQAPRVCKTQWQWDEASRIARKTIEQMQQSIGYN